MLFGKKELVTQPAPAPQPLPQTAVVTAPLSMEDTEELNSNAVSQAAAPTVPLPKRLELPQFIVGCGQSVGKQRDHNEDALFTLTTNLVSDTIQMPFGLYVIADGMGGHQHGEVASGVSVRAMANHVVKKLYMPLFGLSGEQAEDSLQEIMQAGVLEAHRSILKDAMGGGTTLTAVLIMGNQMTITHVGDSRAYAIYPDGRMQTLTHDHSLVKRLQELGQITADEAATHPQRNVLYRALGQGEPFEPDVSTFPVPHAGYLLICSDGLWGVVPERELFNIISTAANPQQACQGMVDAANEAGGPDNISAILVQLPE
jgi:serine/threonine protein phosphatase PrpC